MVTAIVIPIICCYFLYITLKEKKEIDKKWADLEAVPEEAFINGKVLDVHEEKQRFYYYHFIHIVEITLQTSYHVIVARKITPIKETFSIPHISKGEELHLSGNWKEKETFQISRITKSANAPSTHERT
jgi:hypothetical protein